MITRWIHFEELGGDPWVRPIYAAVNAAADQGQCASLPDATRALGLHVATRLTLLPHVVARLNVSCLSVYEKIKTHDEGHVFSAEKDGYAFHLDPSIKYLLIADINSFLFEVNVCADLIIEFAQALFSHVGRSTEKAHILTEIYGADRQANLDPRWFALLDANRNFVAHNGTPYVAVDISNPDSPTLLIMKTNVVAFDDPNSFFSIADLQTISTGFTQTNTLLQQLLISVFR